MSHPHTLLTARPARSLYRNDEENRPRARLVDAVRVLICDVVQPHTAKADTLLLELLVGFLVRRLIPVVIARRDALGQVS